ncbi:hypothetical protein L4X63_17300 [Geomonas sp. Red32]|nr:hypothetical protein [Geomonas sp. Red32]MCM0083345.1 hypothetical protein [Geomonas sp. Red32]
MCGIFGITYREHERPVREESVVAATDLMTHSCRRRSGTSSWRGRCGDG